MNDQAVRHRLVSFCEVSLLDSYFYLLVGRTPELFSIVSLDEQARWNSTYCTGECTSHHEIALAASSMLWDIGHRDTPHPAQQAMLQICLMSANIYFLIKL